MQHKYIKYEGIQIYEFKQMMRNSKVYIKLRRNTKEFDKEQKEVRKDCKKCHFKWTAKKEKWKNDLYAFGGCEKMMNLVAKFCDHFSVSLFLVTQMLACSL